MLPGSAQRAGTDQFGAEGVGGPVGHGAARGHDVAERVRLLGGQHPGHQGGDHRVLQVSLPPAGSPCPAPGPGARGRGPRSSPRGCPLLPSPVLSGESPGPAAVATWNGSRAWGRVPESLRSGLLLRGDVKTQEQGSAPEGEREGVAGCSGVFEVISEQLLPKSRRERSANLPGGPAPASGLLSSLLPLLPPLPSPTHPPPPRTQDAGPFFTSSNHTDSPSHRGVAAADSFSGT